jgi:glucose-1-phosphate thymidylyltransferase
VRTLGVVVVPDHRPANGKAGTMTTALEPVANRPIADHVLDALVEADVDAVLVVVGASDRGSIEAAFGEHQSRFPGGLDYLEQGGNVDLRSGLGAAAPIVGQRACVIHQANGLLAEPLGRLPLHAGQPDVRLLVYHGAGVADQLTPETQHVLHIAAFDDEQSALGLAGVCVFGPGVLASVAQAGKDDAGIDATDVAARVAAAGGKVDLHLVDNWRSYDGDPIDLLELNRITLDQLASMPRYRHQNGNRIEGRVLIDETAFVSSSVIVGPTVIGPGARIEDAYIGPYTSVGAGVRIEGAEIERSIIADRASVMHVGGRLVTSVVGRDARIFRDFSLPRALRLRVGEGTEVSLC